MKQSGSDGSIALKRPGEESFISGYVETPGELGILGVLQDGRDRHIIATKRQSDLLGLNVTRTHFSDVGRETTSFPIDTSSELRDYLCVLYGCDRGALENISIEDLVMLVGDELDLAVADFLMANEDNTTDDSGSDNNSDLRWIQTVKTNSEGSTMPCVFFLMLTKDPVSI